MRRAFSCAVWILLFVALLLFFPLAMACGPAPQWIPDCISACGARLYGTSDCDEFQLAEDRLLAAFHAYPQTCHRLRGVIISMVPVDASGAYRDSWGRMVQCLVRCDRNAMQIGSVPWRQSSYAHETIHLLRCGMDGEDDHSGWTDTEWTAESKANP